MIFHWKNLAKRSLVRRLIQGGPTLHAYLQAIATQLSERLYGWPQVLSSCARNDSSHLGRRWSWGVARWVTSVLDELFEIYVPNVQVMRHSTQPHMGIRGIINEREDKYLFRVNQHIQMGAMSERDLPMLTDIDYIDFVRGAGSAIYCAIAGAVNIVTFKGTTFQGLDVTARHSRSVLRIQVWPSNRLPRNRGTMIKLSLNWRSPDFAKLQSLTSTLHLERRMTSVCC